MMQWEMHRGVVPQMGLWSMARTLPNKMGSYVTPGEDRRFWLDPDLDSLLLVRELGCVETQAQCKNSGCKQEDFTKKKKKDSQPPFKELSHRILVKNCRHLQRNLLTKRLSAALQGTLMVAGPVKRKEDQHSLLSLGASLADQSREPGTQRYSNPR